MKKPIMTFSKHYGLPPRAVSGQVCAVDFELFGLRKRQLHRPAGKFAFATFTLDGHNVYIVNKASQLARAFERVDKAVLTFQNGDFDIRHGRRWADIPPRPPELIWDTFIRERELYAGWYERFALDDLCRRHLGLYLDKSTRKLFGEESGIVTEDMEDYGCIDDVVTWHVQQIQSKISTPDEDRLWAEVDCPALWAVLDFRGIPMDVQMWRDLAKYNQEEALRIRAHLKFNPGSGPQVMAALSDRKIYVENTREQTLEHFKEKSALVRAILQYREHAKRASTYGEKYIAEYVESDGLIYPDFVLIGAETHRMSSRAPNWQQVPRAKEYRACVHVEGEARYVVADYSAQEPHILAQLSGDKALKKVFANGRDVHLEIARTIFQDPKIQKSDERRQTGKTINLAVDYGMTVAGLQHALKITRREAETFLHNYFATYYKVGIWLSEQRANAYENGYVELLGGGKIWLNTYKYGWQNNAVNGPVQGSAARMTKRALGLVHQEYVKRGADARKNFPICAVIHDEIDGWEPDVKSAKRLSRLIDRSMTQAFEELCPDVSSLNCAEVHIVQSWSEK